VEIEAKFIVPNRAALQRLIEATDLGGFPLKRGSVRLVQDSYRDTDDRKFYHADYACRIRRQEGKSIATLKNLGKATGSVHQRQEYEVTLDANESPQDWPVSEARDLVLSLCGDKTLVELFRVDQERYTRKVTSHNKIVAELSIDIVHIETGRKTDDSFEVEVELLPQGTEGDLAAAVQHLEENWHLQPQPLSKFERGLALLDAEDSPTPGILSPEECIVLEEIARGGKPMHITEETVQQPSPRPRTSVKELYQRYAVDQTRAQHIEVLSLAIYDATTLVHSLPVERRNLLKIAAALHHVGFACFPQEYHAAGRDIILAHQVDGVNQLEQSMIASITAFQRRRFKRKRLVQNTAFQHLPDKAQHETLVLAAIIRMATGLDHSQSQTSQIISKEIVTIPTDGASKPAKILIPVQGPFADEDSGYANRRADLWNYLFDVELRFVPYDRFKVVVQSAQSPARPDRSTKLSEHSVLPDDPMSEAGRKVLRLHFSRMLRHEEGTRLGQDIEELHDMRVATRRMRSAFDVFAPYFDPKVLKPFAKDLRRIGRALGHVRDLDVFMEKAQQYLSQTSTEEHGALEPLLEAWQVQRNLARDEMLKTLDGKVYQRFVEAFGTFLITEGAGARPVSLDRPTACRVYQLVPTLIYSRYEVIRGYEPLLTDAPMETLHSLRIEFKRLRYALEFFREVLGPEAEDVIKEVVTVQDRLGNLNDADVACRLLISFLQEWSQAEHREKIIVDGVTRYLLAKQLELRTLVDTFPQIWQHFNRQELRRKLAIAISAL